MTISSLNNDIERTLKEISSLNDKLTHEMKNESDKTKRVLSITKSITKNTPINTVISKNKQIDKLNKEIAQSKSKQTEIQKKIAVKTKVKNDKSIQLQKEQDKENKKIQKEQANAFSKYQKQLEDIKKELVKTVTNTTKATSNIYVQSNDVKYDVFLSHASEDKESFVDEFVQELQNRGVTVWYDTLNIAWGDSLRSKIDEGLKNSRYGIVVLSQSYIKKGWTQYELEGLFNIEMTNGKTILPIWHNISLKEIMNFSPTIAGRKAMNTMMQTPTEIAEICSNFINQK
jgi:hypothetical protein